MAIVVTGVNRDELLAALEHIEEVSQKGRVKWRKTDIARRLDYLQRVFADERFHGRLCYSIFRNLTNYEAATVEAIAKAIQSQKPPVDYTASVYVDGLSKTKRHQYSRELRKLGVRTRKVMGVAKDENNALIRLADAIAGFVRDVLDDTTSKELRTLFEKARRERILIEV